MEKESESYGKQVTNIMPYPDHIFLSNEVGNNTHQRDDGNKGGEKFLTLKGYRSSFHESTSYSLWTCVPITNALGYPVLCALIIKGQRMNPMDVLLLTYLVYPSVMGVISVEIMVQVKFIRDGTNVYGMGR